jgi:3-oxoacyl-[acyl-carrier protein] reductase
MDQRVSSSTSREHDLLGKVALVTGTNRGIGYAIALHLAKRGASILATSTSSSKKVDDLYTHVRSIHARFKDTRPKLSHQAVSLDDPEAHVTIADAVQRDFDGQIDIFINNAAITDRTFPGELDPETLDRLLRCNTALVTDELVKRRYFRRESRIIFISSAESVNCEPDVSIYASTKAANEAMARCYANAFGGRNHAFEFMAGTTANSVLTGLTETGGVQQYGTEVWEKLQDFWVDKQAISRLGKPDDVADVVGFLCSREGRWITGSKVSANGGSIAVI